MPSAPLASRIALVTGAASGLGRATAERFLRQGARVVLCDLPGSSGFKAAEELCREFSYGAVFVPIDVTQEHQVALALDIGEEFFGRAIDTIVNCAGIGLARKTISKNHRKGGKGGNINCDVSGNCNVNVNGNSISDWRVHDLEAFQRVLDVNVTGTFNVVRLAVERMVRARTEANTTTASTSTELELELEPEPELPDGVIVNTASIAAYDGQCGQVAYAASKAAIVGMTLPLARELAFYKIRANAIAPGLFRTPLLARLPTKVQRELAASVPFPSELGDPDDFAMLVQSIVENPMINGEVIRIDGGLRMPPS